METLYIAGEAEVSRTSTILVVSKGKKHRFPVEIPAAYHLYCRRHADHQIPWAVWPQRHPGFVLRSLWLVGWQL